MYRIMIDDRMNLVFKEKNEKGKKEEKKEKFCLNIDYFRIDENDFETDLWKIIETYPKLCLFFRGGGEGFPLRISSSRLNLPESSKRCS